MEDKKRGNLETFSREEQVCKRCSKGFIPTGNYQRYCSRECYCEAQSIYQKERYRTNEEFRRKVSEKRKQRYHEEEEFLIRRNTILSLNGKSVRVKKRLFYGICELCGKDISIKQHMRWHHWNDEYLEWGLWLGNLCHLAVEAAEQRGIVIPLYDKLKELIESW